MRLIPILSGALLAATAASAADPIAKPSPHDVPTTIDRLEQAVETAGASVIARVDHSGSAADAGMELPPSELLIFGNPKLGTPLMQEDQRIGLDLPLRALAYQDANGQVHLIYQDVTALAESYGLDAENEAAAAVSTALEKLTDQAVAEE